KSRCDSPAPPTSSGKLQVRVTTAAELVNLNILDANGRILTSDKRQTKTFHDVDVSEFPAGTYYISVAEEQAELTKKFVIVR
ncbi:MAG: T9SS type A sorting domain-containing protein, partial [Bacteroidota bacterium]